MTDDKRQDSPIEPLCGPRLEVVLLSWLIVLLQAREDDQVSFSWRCADEDVDKDQVQSTREDFNFDLIAVHTVEAELDSFASKIACKTNARRLEHNNKLYLCTTDDRKASNQLEIEVSSRGADLDIQLVRTPDAHSSFLASRHIDALKATIQICTAYPSMLLSECMAPTTLDLDNLWSWNSPLPPLYAECIHERIARQTSRYGNSTAIDAWDGLFTYNQLEEYSTHFAAVLVEMGVKLGDVLPLCFEKSRWTIVAALAAMKAGATFVLIDPSLPLARLQNMAAQVGASVVVSSQMQSPLATQLTPSGTILTIRSELPVDVKQMQEKLDVPSTTTMYIIFTSGSTGTPKGVKISHETYTSSAIPRAKAVGYSDTSRVLDFASYAFDVSIDSMFLTVLSGGCLCIPSDHDRMNDINQAIRNMKINYAGLTPSVARILEPDVIASLEGLGLGGEAVAASDATIWGRSARIIIGYGPCECTIGCTINGDAATGRDYLSIGKGNGAAIWIADPADHEKLMPLGAVGELLVEGPIVGQGYLNDPEKTDAAFIKDPPWLVAGHGKHPGRRGRLYKTGDLGKYDPDGSGGIVFVGRKDTQVKLRGQRVELGEIETQLRNKFSESYEVVVEVIKPEQSGGQATLVAFVSSKSNRGFGNASVQTIDFWPKLSAAVSTAQGEIKKALPIYMLPAAYIPLDAIPKLISSKVDRKQLRQLGTKLDLRSFEVESPSTASVLSDAEERMALAWKQVLPPNDKSLHPDSSFFLLGGDSVKAMKLIPLCRRQGFDINVADVFTNPSLGELTSAARPTSRDQIEDNIQAFSLIQGDIDTSRHEAAVACGVADEHVVDIYPCTPTQESLYTFSLKSEVPYVAQRIATIASHISTDRWKSAWEEVVRKHAILRTRVVQLDQVRFAQVVVDQGLEWRDASDLEQYLLADAQESMAAGQPLARYGIIESEPSRERTMVWTIHHVLYDGWSEPLILETLNAVLSGEVVNEPTPIQHLVRFLSQVGQEATHSYWLRELDGAVGAQFPSLPYRDYVPNQDTIIEHSFQLPVGDSFGFTTANVIRGAWAFVVSHHIRTNDIVFGETLSGRDIALPGVESIIGPLIATVPFRVRVDYNATVAEYLRSIRRSVAARAAYQHMGMQNLRKVSDDAQYACETGTGIVIQPDTAHDLSNLGFTAIDVVRESLHFNPYPLMLACGLHAGGLRICAGFDSDLIKPDQMQRMLKQLETACQRMIEHSDSCLTDISILPDDELDQIWQLNQLAPLALDLTLGRFQAADHVQKGAVYPPPAVSWICSPYNPSILSPIGGYGELWLESNFLPGNTVATPQWLKSGSSSYPGRAGSVAATGDIVTMSGDGSISFVDRRSDYLSAQAQSLDTTGLKACVVDLLPPGTPFAITTSQGSPDCPSTNSSSQVAVVIQLYGQSDDSIEVMPSDQSITVPASVNTSHDFVLASRIPREVCQVLVRLKKLCHNTLPSALTPSAYIIGHFSSTSTAHNIEDLLAAVTPQIPAQLLAEYKHTLDTALATEAASAPLTVEQRVLREHWSSILQVAPDKIGLDDGFFRLGGDSVLGMKLAAKLRTSGWDLSVADIFRTIRFNLMAKAMKLRDIESSASLSYKPFSAFDQPSLTSLLSDIVSPQLVVDQALIDDVYPVTSTQELDILATLHPPRSSFQYTLLYFDDLKSKTRLVTAWRELVRVHDILRTVFVKHSSGYLQVVLRSWETPVVEVSGDQDVEQLVRQHCTRDVESAFKLGEPFVRAAMVQSDAGGSCFVLGLSHALYDGVSLPQMLSDLGSLMVGQSIQSTTSFGQYIALAGQRQHVDSAKEYWRRLLNGSEVTVLDHTSQPANGHALFKSKPVQALQTPEAITFATVLTSAWALVLAREKETIDVCFGNVTSGRMLSLPHLEDIVGPCYQFTPVRIVFERDWTAGDLLNSLQQQTTQSAAYDFLGFKAISKHCTQWTDKPQCFDSIVHHQDEASEDHTLSLGDLVCRVGLQKPHGDAASPLKAVSFTQQGSLHVGIVGLATEAALVDRMLDLLADAVHELSNVASRHSLLSSRLFERTKRLDSPLASD